MVNKKMVDLSNRFGTLEDCVNARRVEGKGTVVSSLARKVGDISHAKLTAEMIHRACLISIGTESGTWSNKREGR